MIFIAATSGFWGFCCDHPILAIVAAFIILFILSGICMAGNSPEFNTEWLKNTDSDVIESKRHHSYLGYYGSFYRCAECGRVGGKLDFYECERDHPNKIGKVYYSPERYCSIFGHKYGIMRIDPCEDWREIDGGRVINGKKYCERCGHVRKVKKYHEYERSGATEVAVAAACVVAVPFVIAGKICEAFDRPERIYDREV